MDLSAIIFVVLALAWAAYLIPKALKHHDELASDRLVEGHSDKVRILSRKSSTTGRPEVVEVETEHVDTVERYSDLERELAPKPRPAVARRPAARPVTHAAARQAAQRRRRVLAVLLLTLAVVWGLTWFAYLPIWAPVVPGVMVVLFLVVARLSVRKAQTRRPVAQHADVEPDEVVTTVVDTVVTTSDVEHGLEQLTDEDTTGLARKDIEAALADDGSLWDPLPMTLPTYVNKARARRTVRTIELTGINSSGHDESDTALAREAEASARDAAQQSGTEGDERKVAGA